MKTFIKQYLLMGTFLTLSLLSGCKKYDSDFVGPEVGVATENFVVLTGIAPSKTSVNFITTPKINFTAQFNERVSYTITIKGRTSGAVKKIIGLSDNIDVSNSVWDGSGEMVFFRVETCDVELSVYGKDSIVSTTTIDINKVRANPGILIANMESGGRTCGVGYFQEPKTYCGASNAVLQNEKTYIDGLNGYKITGKDVSGGKFIGIATNVPILNYYSIPANVSADSVWFNVYIYGSGDTKAYTYIKFKQDDNGNGTSSDASENGFELQLLDLSHTGWKLFSVPYSSLTVSGNKPYGGNGDQVHRPNKITNIEFALWSSEKDKQVELIFDYAAFTIGAPLGK